ncbi:DNA replication licensing factor MCM2 [Entamoeba marina]
MSDHSSPHSSQNFDSKNSEDHNINDEIMDEEDDVYEKEVAIAQRIDDIESDDSSKDGGEDLFDSKIMEEDYDESHESEYNDPLLVNDVAEEPVIDEFEARRLAEEAMEKRDELTRKMMSEDEEEEDDAEVFDILLQQKFRSEKTIPSQKQTQKVIETNVGITTKEVEERMKLREIDILPQEQLKMMISESESKLQTIDKDQIKDMLQKEEVELLVSETLTNFLLYYTEEETSKRVVYVSAIRKMVGMNSSSLHISFLHLAAISKLLAQWLVLHPSQMIPIFSNAATSATLRLYPDYKDIRSTVTVRITDYMTRTAIRDLRHNHVNTLVRCDGIVTRCTAIFPQMVSVKYVCGVCSAKLGPYAINKEQNKIPQLQVCTACLGKGPFSIDVQQTVYRNYQKITIQEPPSSVSAGNVPRTKDVILLSDLIDAAQPGEEIDVTGIFMHNYETGLNRNFGFPVFCTVIEANSIERRTGDVISTSITHEEEQEIRKLANDPVIFQKIINSVAPSIYGHDASKAAIALALFGGEQRILKDKGNHRTRGDINVLLLGDPGTAKKAVFTTGRGSTAVGLTAAVKKDGMSGEWALEGGALVLADEGICLIDEFDKMDDQDRTSIHEAMEQQSISISKAGIVTSLKARCSVIAAANPKGGKYNPSNALIYNVNLTEPIISRFDLIMIVRDVQHLLLILIHFNHPLNSNNRQSVQQIKPNSNVIPHYLLKKYIAFARQNCHPVWSGTTGSSMIQNVYLDMRKSCERFHAGQVTARQIEAINRLAEAHAKMHLRSIITLEDVKVAIRISLKSFIACQKNEHAKLLRNKFQNYLN